MTVEPALDTEVFASEILLTTVRQSRLEAVTNFRYSEVITIWSFNSFSFD